MRFSLLIIFAIFLCACSPKPVFVAIPIFSEDYKERAVKDDALAIKIEKISFSLDNKYSEYFAQSNILLRLNEELRILEENMLKQLSFLLIHKGYKISDEANMSMEVEVAVKLKESSIEKEENKIKSRFYMDIHALSKLNDIENKKSFKIKNMAALEQDLAISYEYPETSYVPTLFMEELYPSLFTLDKLIIRFYKGFLATMQNNIPSVDNGEKPQIENNDTNDIKEPKKEEIIIF